MLPWPPYSPDLSPIEHVWDIIGRRLHALPQPRSEDELWQMVEREWRAIPQDAIRTLIDSLPRRVAACIAVRGDQPASREDPIIPASREDPIKPASREGPIGPSSGPPPAKPKVRFELPKETRSGRRIKPPSRYNESIGRDFRHWKGSDVGDIWMQHPAAVKNYKQTAAINYQDDRARQDGSGRPRATTEREDRAIVRMAVAAPESKLSTIQRVTGTQDAYPSHPCTDKSDYSGVGSDQLGNALTGDV
ncbi:hypothetical protein LAZ67_14002919 [Cordylochernes scorpioides]|uniref:Transposase n=1 Tax=Cordylochernes scorpioides TaxID=51811 RepID=A0ABY6L9S7_9ARAC|nr:hypothetical protein LAZ67_14002919 [Cordylochernes scorpioides]